MRAVEDLVRAGFRDIVIVSQEAGEERSGLQRSWENTELVALDPRGRVVRIRDRWLEGTGSSSSSEVIDDAVYVEEFELHGPIRDTPEFRALLAARDAENAARIRDQAAARADFDLLRPRCPKCGAGMELRPSKRSGAPYFWGCSRYSETGCGGSKTIHPIVWAGLEPLWRRCCW